MLTDLRVLLGTFPARDRIALVLYVFVQFIVSLTDLLGIAIVLPIMQVVTGSSLTDGFIGVIYSLLGAPTPSIFLLELVFLMVVAFALKTCLGLAAQWWTSGLVVRLQSVTSRQLLVSYMTESYLSHRTRSSSELMRTVETATNSAYQRVLLGGVLALIGSGMSVLTIVTLLLVVQPAVTTIAIAYFGLAVFATQYLLGHRNREAGDRAVSAAWIRSTALIDAMDGFREVRTHNAEHHFIQRYDAANTDALQAGRRAGIYQSTPKYVLELAAISGLGVLILAAAAIDDQSEIVATMGIFVAATIRLLPTLVGMTAQIGSIRNGEAGLRIVADELRELRMRATVRVPCASSGGRSEDRPAADLIVRNVCFSYPDGDSEVLNEITVTVPAGTSLALTGLSGSGKTTFVDIVTGLITPTSGQVLYGGVSIEARGASWFQEVAYVPQDVFLIDDSIAANIAFGVAPEHIDQQSLHDAAEKARLGELISTLSEGIDTRVGVHGNRLSGGQRQRIGIARALYRRPSVIVLDEATSALDSVTEQEIAATIRSLAGKVTTIIVAHRLSTVRDVNQLLYLELGRVAAIGRFQQVRQQSTAFAHLVELGNLNATDAGDA